jgi:uncharacterized protein YndB with AHSA1/START domain
MAMIEVRTDRTIHAPADLVYSYVAGLREHRPHYLASAFSDYEVCAGGVGEGSVVRFRIKAARRSRVYEMRVAEPEPGRVLTETDTRSSLVTTFTVIPNDAVSRVKIATTWQGAGGIGGVFERFFAPKALRRVLAEELERLDAYARQRAQAR